MTRLLYKPPKLEHLLLTAIIALYCLHFMLLIAPTQSLLKPLYKRYIWDKADFVSLSNYTDQVDWLGLMYVNVVPNDILAAYINVIRDGVDLYLQL